MANIFLLRKKSWFIRHDTFIGYEISIMLSQINIFYIFRINFEDYTRGKLIWKKKEVHFGFLFLH